MSTARTFPKRPIADKQQSFGFLVDPLDSIEGPAKDWFVGTFPNGPTPIQSLAWPAIAARKNALLVAPTGTGKTLAAFLAIISELVRRRMSDQLEPVLKCVYVSPLRSLGQDVERNLNIPLHAIGEKLGLAGPPIRAAVRTGDTPAHQRRKLLENPPQILITTPESLSLLLAQKPWQAMWSSVEHLIVDEIHALVPNKRGADLMVSLERLAAYPRQDPQRIGLSATCKPATPVARFLVGPERPCQVIDAATIAEPDPLELHVESLLAPEESPFRPLTYQRLLSRLCKMTVENRTTVIFANTRALTEKLTHDLRRSMLRIDPTWDDTTIGAHHSALDAKRRREVERGLQDGTMRAVVSSTSLELGVDIASADLSALVGLPGSVSRCLQRVGRAGHSVGITTKGVLLAATHAELAGAAVLASEARLGRIEPLRPIQAPLDVLCQQIIGMACCDDWNEDDAYALVRRAEPMANLERKDFDDCLAFLSGQLAAPSGARNDEESPGTRWTSARLWREKGYFGIRSRRVIRWLWSNIGTINAEDSIRVKSEGCDLGTLEGPYAEALQPGDRFLLDGRSFEVRSLKSGTLAVKPTGEEGNLPRWTSDRQSLSPQVALELCKFREHAGRLLETEGAELLRDWLAEDYQLDEPAAMVLEELFTAQAQVSEIPSADLLLVEEWPSKDGYTYTFHAPLPRSACEALGRAFAARLGKSEGRNLGFVVADLGWSIELGGDDRLETDQLAPLLSVENLYEDVLEGVDRGDLLSRRFRHVASTALMVLKNPEGGGKQRVGGMNWVSSRLYPLVKACCPDHPLLRETRREVLMDRLDAPAALAWLSSRPPARLRRLSGPSPLALAWIDPTGAEQLLFETPAGALKRLHERLVGARHVG